MHDSTVRPALTEPSSSLTSRIFQHGRCPVQVVHLFSWELHRPVCLLGSGQAGSAADALEALARQVAAADAAQAAAGTEPVRLQEATEGSGAEGAAGRGERRPPGAPPPEWPYEWLGAPAVAALAALLCAAAALPGGKAKLALMHVARGEEAVEAELARQGINVQA
jgi:hypothetical protein